MGTPRTTAGIRFGNLTTIQISLSAANQFSDAQASDDLGGPGPFLVMDRGIFKYPQQATGGRIVCPPDTGRPIRLAHLAANLGASATLAVHVAGYDGTAGRPDNTSGEPYAASDAPLYREGDIIADSFTATQYISKTYDIRVSDPCVLLHPGQHLYFISTGASTGILRATFALGWDLS